MSQPASFGNGPNSVHEESANSAVFSGLDWSTPKPSIATHIMKQTPDMMLTLKSLNDDYSVFEITKVEVLWGESNKPTKDRSKNQACQALFTGTRWSVSKGTAMFCVVPPRDMGNDTHAEFINLSITSTVSAKNTVSATVAYKYQCSKRYHLCSEEIPIDGFQEWAAQMRASPFPGKGPIFASDEEDKLSKVNTLLGPKFAKGSVWADGQRASS